MEARRWNKRFRTFGKRRNCICQSKGFVCLTRRFAGGAKGFAGWIREFAVRLAGRFGPKRGSDGGSQGAAGRQKRRAGRGRGSGAKRGFGPDSGLAGLLFAAPSLLGVGLLILLPFADVIRRSFFESVGGGFVGLRNYAAVLQNEAFRIAAGNTLRFVAICIPLLVLLSLALAALLYSLKQGRDLLKAAFLLPMAVPAASVVLIWKLFFHENGLLSGLAVSLGGTPIDFMQTRAAFFVLIVSYLWRNLGYDMILFMAGLSGIPQSLYEAAALDGAGRVKMFFRITLPNLTAILFTIFVLSLLNSFKVFREAYLVAGEHPHTSMYLLQHLFNNWFLSLDVDKLCAGATLTAVVIFGLILLLHKAWGETYE